VIAEWTKNNAISWAVFQSLASSFHLINHARLTSIWISHFWIKTKTEEGSSHNLSFFDYLDGNTFHLTDCFIPSNDSTRDCEVRLAPDFFVSEVANGHCRLLFFFVLLGDFIVLPRSLAEQPQVQKWHLSPFFCRILDERFCCKYA